MQNVQNVQKSTPGNIFMDVPQAFPKPSSTSLHMPLGLGQPLWHVRKDRGKFVAWGMVEERLRLECIACNHWGTLQIHFVLITYPLSTRSPSIPHQFHLCHNLSSTFPQPWMQNVRKECDKAIPSFLKHSSSLPQVFCKPSHYAHNRMQNEN